MSRRVLAFSLPLALILTAAPAAASPAAAPRAALRSFVCERAANPLDRAVGVTAVMRPLRRTQAMELKFELERRPAGRHWFGPVRGRYLGTWLHPADATLGQRPSDVWVLNKPVVNLSAPASYRFQVTFRWLSSSAVIATQTRVSQSCAQPGKPVG